MGNWALRRLGQQYAAVRWIDGRRERRRVGADRGAAERAVARLNGASRQIRTVEDIWAAYCQEKSGLAVIETMRHTAKALAPVFWALTPDMISLDHCAAHTAARRGAGISDGTIHTELGHLRTVLRWALKRRHVDHAPHIERPQKPPPRDHYLTREDVQAILNAAELPHVRLYVILMITTSGRIGAILDLTWDRVDLDAGMICLANPDDPVRRKGRATIPINRTAAAALSEAKHAALSDHVIEWGGKRCASIKRSLASTCKRAGVRATAHVFRHSAAVWMATAGLDDRQIADFLGHGNAAMVRKVYGRFRPEYLKDAAEILELDPVAVQPNRRALRK